MADRSRYDATGAESEFEPGSRGRVLRNRLGIKSVREMARAESVALLEAQEWMVDEFTSTHRFNATDIQRIHGRWLGNIYEWAGRYRNVNTAKGDFQFAAAAQVPRLMTQLHAGPLSKFTPCVPGPHDVIAEALAVVHAELVLIHPFRDGNGRVARLVALTMALQAGLPPLDFTRMQGRGKAAYFAAVQAALSRDYGPMTAVFSAVVRRSLQQQNG